MRVYGYNNSVRRTFFSFKESKSSVAILNCEMKKSGQLELLVGQNSHVAKSDKTFKIPEDLPRKSSKQITIDNLQGMARFQRVTLKVKAVKVDDAGQVSGGKMKQDITVCDATGSARLTIWADEIRKIEQGKSYLLSGMVVKEFRGRKSLSTSVDKTSEIQLIDDIGKVSTEDGTLCEQHIHDVRIIGIKHLDKYQGCLKCNTKLIPYENDTDLGYCQKCQMIQCPDASKQILNAQLMIEAKLMMKS